MQEAFHLAALVLLELHEKTAVCIPDCEPAYLIWRTKYLQPRLLESCRQDLSHSIKTRFLTESCHCTSFNNPGDDQITIFPILELNPKPAFIFPIFCFLEVSWSPVWQVLSSSAETSHFKEIQHRKRVQIFAPKHQMSLIRVNVRF